MNLDQLLQKAIENNAADLHLVAEQNPRARIHGELQMLVDAVLSACELEQMLLAILDQRCLELFTANGEVDCAYVALNRRFRVNIYRQMGKIAGVFRIIPVEIANFQQLHLPEVLAEIASVQNGLVLVTGPTGSGKSTTLAAMVDYLNQSKAKNIITIEDPIEYVHSSKKCLISQREIFTDTKSFNAALRAVLRQDPDIILIGELRDLETIRLALTAAETGHLVLATLHTVSAAKTISRMVDVFPGAEKDLVRTMLADSLQAVISQILIKTAAGKITAATEIMRTIPAISNLIRENKLVQINSVMQTNAALGMHTLEQSMRKLDVSNG